MARQRLCLALVVPGALGIEVDGLRRALGDRSLGRIPPHLTLVPPVNVHDDRLEDALAVVRGAAHRAGPLRLRLGPVTTFLPDNPVVYLAVDGDLEALWALRWALSQGPLERPETRPFVPHVTVATRMDAGRIPAAVDALADFAVDVTVDRVHILRQEPDRVWRPWADERLAVPAVVGRGGLPVELATSGRPPPDAAHLLATAGDRRGDHGPDGGGADAEGDGDSGGHGLDAMFAVTGRRAGEVVGCAAGWSTGRVCRLALVVVADGARRQGIGRHLLAAVEDLGRARGCTLLDAVVPDAPATEALFAGAGWRAVDTSAAAGVGPERGRSWVRSIRA